MRGKLYRFLNSFWPIGLIFLLSIFSWKTLLLPGFFKIHDFQHVARLFELNKSLLAGQFPVRWVADLGFGYGYPLFNFYPPLVYYLGELFHLSLGTGFLDSTKIVWAVALVGSAVSMYFFSKEFFGKIAGIVAAIFYLYAPYHAVDAYVRGALSELFSFVWLPLILLFSHKSIHTGKTSNTILTGIFLSLLMLTHPLIFLPFFGLYTIWHFALVLISGSKNLLRQTFNFALSSTICFGLSAFFWLPSIFEKQFTLTDQFLTQGLASYKIHFVCLSQLWNSSWGFGGSVPGCADGLSFMIGKIYILPVILSIGLVAFYLLKKQKNERISIVLVSTFLLLISLLMTTQYSKPIWDYVEPLWYLQFPWRFLEFSTLFASLLSAFVVYSLRDKKVKIIGAVILVAALLVVQVKYFMPQFSDFNSSDQTLTTEEQIKWVVSGTSFEYMPKGLPVRIEKSGGNMLDIDKNQIGQPGYDLKSGNLEIPKFDYHPSSVTLSGKSAHGAVVQFPITYFPGWTATVDQKTVLIDSNNRLKLITVSFPSGNHVLKLNFVNTAVRNIGNMISLVAILALPLVFYGTRRNKK